jgi:hypothetical protein
MTFGPYLSGYYDIERQLPEYLWQKACDFFRKEESEKNSISTIEALEERRKRIYKHYVAAIGGLPKERTPLNPICTGLSYIFSFL